VSSPTLRRREVPAFGEWPADVHPVLRRVYAARGVLDGADGELRLGRMLHPDTLGGLDAATTLLCEALRREQRIVVVGDFDADGATGTAVAVRGLRLLGARHVGFRVPHRIRHGYGLSPELVDDLRSDAPDLILTVDSGIACLRGVEAANAAGLRVIVTDHHLPGPVLPAAAAIVNPNLDGDAFPSKALAGVGVVFYLLLALRRVLREQRWFEQHGIAEPDLAELLDLVALGTVADMVPLDANNRVLVQAGLRRMRAGQIRPGLRALVEVAGRRLERIGTADLGYALAPRVNAAGRLEDMSLGIACLLSESAAQAQALASQLDAINAERKELQQQMLEQAESLVARWPGLGATGLPHGVCVFDPDWHPGVVGLVASRLKDRLHRPVIAFAPAGEDGELRGSARSIAGFHVRDALADLAARTPGLIGRFGGHAMAAGLSLPRANFERFSEAFTQLAAQRIDAAALQAELWSDGPLARADIGRTLAEQLRLAGPWGQGFPEPLFDDEFELQEWRVVGEAHLKMRLRHRDGGEVLDAIEFGGWQGRPPASRLRLAFHLELDDWRDRGGVQLLVRHRFGPQQGVD
jgi:single-stranded-DNA-specific exonuclease